MRENDNKNSTNGSDSTHSQEITSMSLAEALLEEFQERFLAGDDPDPQAYEMAYTGRDREDFARMLAVSRLLLAEGVLRRRRNDIPTSQ